jgi:hypothetical protein
MKKYALIGLLVLSFSSSAQADPESCRAAIDEYNMAVDSISTALKRYARCVSDSQAHDDCSREFRRLKSAQDDFETAVSSYGLECGD